MLQMFGKNAGPVSPKAHGAWLGAGTGSFIGSAIIALIQTYWTHKALPPEIDSLIIGAAGALTAYIGAWLMPLIDPTPKPSATTTTPDPSPRTSRAARLTGEQATGNTLAYGVTGGAAGQLASDGSARVAGTSSRTLDAGGAKPKTTRGSAASS